MFKKALVFSLFLGIASGYAQQKKALTHEDYDKWKRISNSDISKDGNIIVATVETQTGRGDGYVKIFNAQTGRSFTFKNGYRTKISDDGNFVFFLRKPPYELTRQEKKDEVKEEERQKEVFFIFDVRNHRLMDSVKRVKNYEIPEKTTGWVVLEKHKDLKPKKDSTAKKASAEKDTLQAKKPKNLAREADYGLVYNLKNRSTDTIFQIKEFELPEEGNQFIFSTTKGEKKGDLGVYSYDVQNGRKQVLDTGRYVYGKLAIDNSGRQLAYLSAKDSTETDSLKFELFFVEGNQVEQITDILGRNLRENWQLSGAQSPYFSENGKRLSFTPGP